MLAGLAGWGLFFWWVPGWAMGALAVVLGIGVSIAVGYDLKKAIERRMVVDEITHRAELQEQLDAINDVGAVTTPGNIQEIRPDASHNKTRG